MAVRKTYKACKEGQVRNPKTNRCKKTTTQKNKKMRKSATPIRQQPPSKMTDLIMQESELASLKSKNAHNMAALIDAIKTTSFEMKNFRKKDYYKYYEKYINKNGFTLDADIFNTSTIGSKGKGTIQQFNAKVNKLNELLVKNGFMPGVTPDQRVVAYLWNVNDIHYHTFYGHILDSVEDLPKEVCEEFMDIIEDNHDKFVSEKQVKQGVAKFLLQQYKKGGLVNMDCEAMYNRKFNTITDTSPRDQIIDIILS